MATPFFGSGPFTHYDLGDQGAVEGYGWAIGYWGYISNGETRRDIDLTEVWSYTVPDHTKMTAQALNVMASMPTVIGGTLFNTTRVGLAYRGGILTISVDASVVYEVEARKSGWYEAVASTGSQYSQAKHGDGSIFNLEFGDGIQLTAGQSLTASLNVTNLSLTVDGIRPQVHKVRFFGRRTDTGAFWQTFAVIRPGTHGTVALLWDTNTNLSATSYTVPAGGVTILGANIRGDCGDFMVMGVNLLLLNDVYIGSCGFAFRQGGSNLSPHTFFLGGAELYPGDRLSLRACLGPDLGQTISAVLVGKEEYWGPSYSRPRATMP